MAIIYYTRMFQAVPSLMPVYKRLGGAFVTSRLSTAKSIKRVYHGVDIYKEGKFFPSFSSANKALKSAKLIVTGAPYYNVLKSYSAQKYMVFHGTYAYMGLKEVKRLEHFDKVCALGPRMMDALEHGGLAGKTILSGYLPFIDFPERNINDRSVFLESLGLDPLRKTIVYLPWGKPFGSWDLMAKKLLIETPPEYNLILRPHPSHSNSFRVDDFVDFFKIKQLVKGRNFTYLDLTSQKLSSIYANVDLVISDGTSPAEESLFYDIPQLFIETNRFSRDKVVSMLQAQGSDDRHVEKVLELYSCGPSVSPQSLNLSKLIGDAFLDSNRYANARKNYFNYVFGNHSFDLQNALIDSISGYAE